MNRLRSSNRLVQIKERHFPKPPTDRATSVDSGERKKVEALGQIDWANSKIYRDL